MLTLSKAGFFAVLFVLAGSVCSFAQSEKAPGADSSNYAEVEKFILEKLSAGSVANLEEKFKDTPEKRVIPATFLMGLLLDPAKANVHRNGVGISGARIVGKVEVSNAEIDTYVFLTQCQFDDVLFFQTVFKKGLVIDGSSFAGEASFRGTTVMNNFSAYDSKFLNENKTVNFIILRVNGPVEFDGVTFAGPVNFTYAEIDGSFGLNRAQFLCKDTATLRCDDSEISFNSMRIRNGFFAEGATFERPVDLINLKVTDNFEGNNAVFKKRADFEMMTVGRNLFLPETIFAQLASFTSVNVGENIDLSRAHFQSERAEFLDAKAGGVMIHKTIFTRAPNLTNMSYQNIYPRDGLLELIKNSESDYSAYKTLEQYLQKNGFTSQADDVFIEMKLYERRKGLNWFDSIKSYFSQALQGFGRRPQRVLYYDLIVLLFGAFLFRRKKMALKPDALKSEDGTTTTTEEQLPPYHAFLYSLTLFAPTIDTQYTNNWAPERQHRKTRWYLQVHKVLGYILVPLTIAIWTGIFR